MAEVISFAEVKRARRRAAQREYTVACMEIVQVNLRLALHLFSTAPATERPVRARQVRQLAELLEYVADW